MKYKSIPMEEEMREGGLPLTLVQHYMECAQVETKR
jgi:hypothetical protein